MNAESSDKQGTVDPNAEEWWQDSSLGNDELADALGTHSWFHHGEPNPTALLMREAATRIRKLSALSATLPKIDNLIGRLKRKIEQPTTHPSEDWVSLGSEALILLSEVGSSARVELLREASDCLRLALDKSGADSELDGVAWERCENCIEAITRYVGEKK